MVLANPLKTCAIASARIKSDRVDARDLTHLLRGDPGAECYVPPRELREIRALVRHRAALVHMRATVKNRVQAIIDGYGFRCTHSDMFDKGGLRWLKGLELGALDRLIMENHLGHVEDPGRESIRLDTGGGYAFVLYGFASFTSTPWPSRAS